MTQKMMIVWLIVALVAGLALGFGFRSPIAGTLNLNALELPTDCTVTASPTSFLGIIGTAYAQQIPCQKQMFDCSWSGGQWVFIGPPSNGKGICIYTNKWNSLQWKRFMECLNKALETPPPAPPAQGITSSEYNACLLTGQG